MQDWMFETGFAPAVNLPEAQPFGAAEPWVPPVGAQAKPTDEDWTSPLSDVTELGEVVVTGTRSGTQFRSHDSYDDWGGYDTGSDADQWGYSVDPEPPPQDSYDGCQDRRSDTIAESANSIINGKSDSHRIEYGTLIWRDDAGNLHHTEVTAGNNGFWTPPVAPTGGGFHSWSQVVGYVHSHPTEVFQNGQWVTVSPESHFEQPSSGDWQAADFYIREGASAENFTIYVSFAGQVREFDSRTNVSQSRDPQTHPAGHGTESGDYLPGGSCP